MRAFSILFIAALLVHAPHRAASAAAPPAPKDFQYCADITGTMRTDSLYQLHLSDEILGKAGAGLEDLRIFGPSQQEIPSVVLESAPAAREVETYPLEITGFSGDGSSAVVTMKLPEKYRPISELYLDIAESDFKKGATLSGSSDGKSWKVLTEAAIYDFSSQVALRKTKIEFKPSSCRFYRLVLTGMQPAGEGGGPSIKLRYEGLDFSVGNGMKRDIRIRAVEGRTAVPKETAPVYDEKAFAGPAPLIDKNGNTVIVLKAGLPMDRLSLDIANPYYHRMVTLFAGESGQEDSYQMVTRNAVYRFPLSTDRQEARNVIEFSTPKHTYYKIVIENRNNPPLDVRRVTFSWVRKNLYFVALAGGGGYSLCFVNPALAAPDYDLGHFLTKSTVALHTAEKRETALVRQNTEFAPKKPAEVRAQRDKIILRVVVVFLVTAIGYWLYALMKKMSRQNGP